MPPNEVTEMWREVKEQQKKHRRATAEDASQHLPRLSEFCQSMGCSIHAQSETHWIVRDRHGSVRFQYWPSTQKMQRAKGGKVSKQITVEKLQDRIRQERW